MQNNSSNPLINQLYRQSIRRIFLINLVNNTILFSIFGILVYDFSIIIKATSPNLNANIIIVLLFAVPLAAIYKTFKDLPSIYFILASIDHKAATRGTFSLLNEVSRKEPTNTNVRVLLEKSERLMKSLSMHKIFPWHLLWNGYLGAALAFTAILWVAIPEHQKPTVSVAHLEENSPSKDFSVKKDDPLISAFKNNTQTTKTNENGESTKTDNKTLSQKNAKETSSQDVKGIVDQTSSNNKNENEAIKNVVSPMEIAKNKSGNSGSGSEEAHTEKTTDIKNNTHNGIAKEEKIKLTESIQDGSSERNSAQVSNPKSIDENKLNAATPTIKTQKINNLSDMVSTKYQKIIENYFSSED